MRIPFLRGLVLLAAAGSLAPLRAQVVRGRVVDRSTGAAVEGGVVLLVTGQRLGVVRATTDETGAFELQAPGPGQYRLQFERPGYRLLITPPFDLGARETVDYGLPVTPLAPYELDTAVVEGQVVPARLSGFYQRRARGVGAFLTRQEF